MKFTPEDVVFTHKIPDSKIVSLEKGYQNTTLGKEKVGGLNHILYKRLNHFTGKDISKEEIPNVLMDAVSQGGKNIVGKNAGADVYEILHNGKKKYIAIGIGSNGYIVRANPVNTWK